MQLADHGAMLRKGFDSGAGLVGEELGLGALRVGERAEAGGLAGPMISVRSPSSAGPRSDFWRLVKSDTGRLQGAGAKASPDLWVCHSIQKYSISGTINAECINSVINNRHLTQ